jgi:hypothetical protein
MRIKTIINNNNKILVLITTASIVIRYLLPKLEQIASYKSEELTSFEQQIQFLYDERERVQLFSRR